MKHQRRWTRRWLKNYPVGHWVQVQPRANPTIEFLIPLEPFLFQALDIVLLDFDLTSQTCDVFLHLLQLHEQLALSRDRRLRDCPGRGAVRTVT